MPCFTVELRIEGETLVPERISAELGLIPTMTRHAGDKRSATSVYTQSLWAYSGDQPFAEWGSLEEGMSHLINKLAPVMSQVMQYREEFGVYWWCGLFHESADAETRLSATALAALGEWGIGFILKNYCSACD